MKKEFKLSIWIKIEELNIVIMNNNSFLGEFFTPALTGVLSLVPE